MTVALEIEDCDAIGLARDCVRHYEPKEKASEAVYIATGIICGSDDIDEDEIRLGDGLDDNIRVIEALVSKCLDIIKIVPEPDRSRVMKRLNLAECGKSMVVLPRRSVKELLDRSYEVSEYTRLNMSIHHPDIPTVSAIARLDSVSKRIQTRMYSSE